MIKENINEKYHKENKNTYRIEHFEDIQNEIMSSIKCKLNSRNDTVQRIKRMMEIIDYYNKNKANEDKKNMAEISDYLQNYSDMTFNEYKQMKAAK